MRSTPLPLVIGTGCGKYADEAVELAVRSTRLGCSFQGDRWSIEREVHLEWCKATTAAQHAQEDQARRSSLETCTLCRQYANQAVAQASQAQANQCGFTGTGWLTDPGPHFAWCMNASPGQRTEERENRQLALENCGKVETFPNPRYLELPADFCMYRRIEIHSSTPIEGELYDYDFGWECGNSNVASSYCISQGYDEAIAFTVAAEKATADTMTLGGASKCRAKIALANCRTFDSITCRGRHFGVETIATQPASQGAALQISRTARQLKTKAELCRDYARLAVRQYHLATSSWCTIGASGFVAPVWHGDPEVHEKWCLSASAAAVDSELATRNARLAECWPQERKRFEHPAVNGVRLDVYMERRKGNRLEADSPQRAADTFCQSQGYEKAVPDWKYYGTTYEAEELDKTYYIGIGEECNTDWPDFAKECVAMNHVFCERHRNQ